MKRELKGQTVVYDHKHCRRTLVYSGGAWFARFRGMWWPVEGRGTLWWIVGTPRRRLM